MEEGGEDPPPSDLVRGEDVCTEDRNCPAAWPKLNGV